MLRPPGCFARLRDAIDRILASDRALSLVVAMVRPRGPDSTMRGFAPLQQHVVWQPSVNLAVPAALVLTCRCCAALCCAGDGAGGWSVRGGGAPAGRIQGKRSLGADTGAPLVAVLRPHFNALMWNATAAHSGFAGCCVTSGGMPAHVHFCWHACSCAALPVAHLPARPPPATPQALRKAQQLSSSEISEI